MLTWRALQHDLLASPVAALQTPHELHSFVWKLTAGSPSEGFHIHTDQAAGAWTGFAEVARSEADNNRASLASAVRSWWPGVVTAANAHNHLGRASAAPLEWPGVARTEAAHRKINWVR
jgi:hypothetical protein